MKILVGILGYLVLPLCVFSQMSSTSQTLRSPCKQYFGVIWQSEKIPGGFMARLSEEQGEWWQKKGSKKYQSACLDLAKATYWIVWTSETESVEVDVPKVQSAITTTQVPAVVGTPAMQGGRQISPAPVGTATATSTAVWTENRTETRSYEHASLFVFATDGKPLPDGGQLVSAPVYYSKHVGKWIWSKPTRDVFEDALKFIIGREAR